MNLQFEPNIMHTDPLSRPGPAVSLAYLLSIFFNSQFFIHNQISNIFTILNVSAISKFVCTGKNLKDVRVCGKTKMFRKWKDRRKLFLS